MEAASETMRSAVSNVAATANTTTPQVVHGGHHTIDPHLAACIPFVFLMLVMAFTPLTPLAHAWEPLRHKLILMVILAVAMWIYYGVSFGQAGADAMLIQLVDWINFVALVGSLYVTAGGIYFDYDVMAEPWFNSLFLVGGAVLSNITGTTGACMILIRIFVHRNKQRLAHHHICFFIFL